MRFLVLLLLLLPSLSWAQQLKGSVQAADSTALPGATVILMHPQDSTLAYFVSSNAKGDFQFFGVEKGNYLLQVSLMSYKTYWDNLSIEKNQQLPPIRLQERPSAIDEIAVEAERIPIRITDDTIAYDAKAFKSGKYDNVGKLLDKMPGMEVDRDGNLKAQGEKVQQITVDGEEFFGGDSRIALENLPADAIDEVQVFDAQSEESVFTGVDDGQREKTVNLRLKDDKKKGGFGQVEGAYGAPNHRYDGRGNLNIFGPKLQLSAIGSFNNINEQSFSFRDYIDLMGGFQSLLEGNIELQLDDNNPLVPLLMGQDRGITQSGGGGINANIKLNKKSELHFNYLMSQLRRTIEENSQLEQFTGVQDFNEQVQQNDTLRSFYQNFRSDWEYNFDKHTQLQSQVALRWNQSNYQRQGERERLSPQSLQSRLQQDFSSAQHGQGLGTRIDFRKRLSKPGRSYTIMANAGHSNRQAEQFNQSQTRLFNQNGQLIRVDSLFQEQQMPRSETQGGGRFRYTEPVGKKGYLTLKASGQFSQIRRQSDFFDIASEQPTFIDSLSNRFERDYQRQRLGLQYQHNTPKQQWSLGLDWQRSLLAGQVGNQSPIRQQFHFPIGRFNWRWKIKQQQFVNFRYNGNLAEPRLEQLQPVVNNNNPLAISLGNPNLRPEYQHNFNFSYRWFNQFSFTSVFINAQSTLRQNAIVQSQELNENLAFVNRPTNVDLTQQHRLKIDFSTPLRRFNLKTNAELSAGLQEAVALINDQENRNLAQEYGLELGIQNRKKKHWDWELAWSANWNVNYLSLSQEGPQRFLNQAIEAVVEVPLGEKWQLNSELDYRIYADQRFAEQVFVPLWSASVERYFLEGERLRLQFRVANILDQQQLVQRQNVGYITQDSRFNTLGRYFMLGITYKIMRLGKS